MVDIAADGEVAYSPVLAGWEQQAETDGVAAALLVGIVPALVRSVSWAHRLPVVEPVRTAPQHLDGGLAGRGGGPRAEPGRVR